MEVILNIYIELKFRSSYSANLVVIFKNLVFKLTNLLIEKKIVSGFFVMFVIGLGLIF